MENPIKNEALSNVRESKEAPPDFLKIFNERLQGIKPKIGQDAKDLATWYKDPKITEIAKEVPAVFFNPNNLVEFTPPTDIWIEDPKNLDTESHYIHDQVTRRLAEFLKTKEVPFCLPGYILESGDKTRYLILERTRVKFAKDMLKRSKKHGKPEGVAILDVLNRYEISRVLEKTSIEDEDSTSLAGSSRTVIGMLDKRREDIALINLARKHGMTNSQYLRLKILAKSLFEARQQVSLDEIARSIVNDPENTTIPVKNSLK